MSSISSPINNPARIANAIVSNTPNIIGNKITGNVNTKLNLNIIDITNRNTLGGKLKRSRNRQKDLKINHFFLLGLCEK